MFKGSKLWVLSNLLMKFIKFNKQEFYIFRSIKMFIYFVSLLH